MFVQLAQTLANHRLNQFLEHVFARLFLIRQIADRFARTRRIDERRFHGELVEHSFVHVRNLRQHAIVDVLAILERRAIVDEQGQVGQLTSGLGMFAVHLKRRQTACEQLLGDLSVQIEHERIGRRQRRRRSAGDGKLFQEIRGNVSQPNAAQTVGPVETVGEQEHERLIDDFIGLYQIDGQLAQLIRRRRGS